MVIDKTFSQINLIQTILKEYLTIKEVCNVGTVYSSEENKIHIELNCGMAGASYTMQIDDLLEEDDPDTMIKLLLIQMKDIGLEV